MDGREGRTGGTGGTGGWDCRHGQTDGEMDGLID